MKDHFIHLFFRTIHTSRFVSFFHRNFPENHKLFLLSKSNEKIENAYLVNNFRQLVILMKCLTKCKGIVVHGFWWPLPLLFCLQPWNIKKISWVIWGGDIYPFVNVTHYSILLRLKKSIHAFVAKRCKVIMGFKGDYNIVCNVFKTNARYLETLYYTSYQWDLLDTISSFPMQDNVNILIGNSATPSNMHIECLNLLSKYAKNNIRIYCLLSYSREDIYIRQLLNVGRTIFGDNFIPIFDTLNFDSYVKFLRSMDVAVMSHNRQQGVGTIDLLLALGVKIFIRSEVSTYMHYLNNHVYVADYNIIETLSYDDFIEWDKEQQSRNMMNMRILQSEANIVCMWNKVFEMY